LRGCALSSFQTLFSSEGHLGKTPFGAFHKARTKSNLPSEVVALASLVSTYCDVAVLALQDGNNDREATRFPMRIKRSIPSKSPRNATAVDGGLAGR